MAAISSPTSLATFTSSHASSSKLPHVTLNPVKGSLGKLAVVAVQGDGVWTYDLKTLRPTTSFTLPPTTEFSTAPLSYIPVPPSTKTGKNKQKAKEEDAMDLDVTEEAVEDLQRVTIVGIQNGEGVKKGEEGRSLWAWKGEDGSEKQVLKLQFPAVALHHLSSPSHPVLIVGSSKLAALDLQLSVKHVELPSFRYITDILTSKIISSSSATSKLVTVDGKGHIRVIKIDHPDSGPLRAETLSRGNLSLDKSFILVSADVSDDGTVNAIGVDNHLYSRNIRDLSTPLPTTWPKILHPSASSPILSLESISNPLSLIPTTYPNPSLLLAVTSPSLPAVLISTSISAFASSGTFAGLSILAQPNTDLTTVGVVMSHRNTESTGSRSIVYVCEVTTPSIGVGMNMLLGSHEKTVPYLSTKPDTGIETKSESAVSADKLLVDLKTALKGAGSPKPAEDLWSKFVANQNPESVTFPELSDDSANLPESFVREVVNVVFNACLTRRVGESEAEEVKVSKTGIYAGSIIKNLISRKLVNDSMLKGGVVAGGLLPSGDWGTIMLALSNMNTIPSSALVKLISSLIHTPESGAPKLPQFLTQLFSSTTPDATYRVELRKGLSVEDATTVLEVLVIWAEECVDKRTEGLKSWLDGREGESRLAGGPSLEAIISHSSLLLDSHLPLFLTHELSHALLARLQQTTEPLLLLQNQLRQLRAPVEAVLTLARRERLRNEEIEAKRDAKRANSIMLGRKGKAVEKEGRGGLPQEVVGKWKVEDFVF